MRKFTRPIDLARHKEQQLRKMRGSFEQEFDKIVRESMQDGINLTGGGLSLKRLRKMGHPYGRGPRPNTFSGGGLKRGAGRMKAPNLPINQQSGRLRRSWHVKRTGLTWVLSNKARHHKYILSPWGTRKMVGRGLWGSRRFTGQPDGLMARYSRARLKALVNVMRRRVRSFI